MTDEQTQQTAEPKGYGLRLHFRLVMAGAITAFLGIAAVCAFLVYRQAHVLHDEISRSTIDLQVAIIDRGHTVADSMVRSMENAIAGYNFTFVADSMQRVQDSSGGIAYGFVTNAAGIVIVHTDPEQVGTKRETLAGRVDDVARGASDIDNGIFEVTHPIFVGGAPWGNMVLAFDFRPIQERAALAFARGRDIMVEATTTALLVASFVMMAGIGISILFSRRLLAPIAHLADDASAIAAGNLNREIRAVDSEDEIGFLARQFELMRRSIRTYIGELVVAKEKAEAATREEKRLRGQIQQHSRLLEAKVQERTAELQQINARLTEHDRLKTEFLSNVSHELRSPLAAIASASKIISRYGDQNKKSGKKFSAVIMDEADRLGRLINDLLDLAKIEAGRVEWNMDALGDPVDLLAHVVTTFKPLATESDICLDLDCPASLPNVYGDRDRLIQVLTNLCSNAMKFTPAGGRITISGEVATVDERNVIRVVVQDTGPGIPQDELEKVFDRFHQAKARKMDINKPKGTGLGLAICREVITHHGGEIWAEAPPEGGTRMVFFIPMDTLPADAPDDGSTPTHTG
jgi:signal transduction histidine kinase